MNYELWSMYANIASERFLNGDCLHNICVVKTTIN